MRWDFIDTHVQLIHKYLLYCILFCLVFSSSSSELWPLLKGDVKEEKGKKIIIITGLSFHPSNKRTRDILHGR